MKNRIYEIDYIRTICVIWIVGFWHMPNYISNKFSSIFNNSLLFQITYCMLAIFVLISGYFACKYKIENFQNAVQYYKNRFIRIYPLFAIASILFVLLSINPKNTLFNMLIGMGLSKKPYPLTLWFICMLLFFYLVAPILLLISNKHKRMLLPFMVLIEILFWRLNICYDFDIRLVYYWPLFAMGILVYKNDIVNFLKAICNKIYRKIVFQEKKHEYNKKMNNINKYLIILCECIIYISFPICIFLINAERGG